MNAGLAIQNTVNLAGRPLGPWTGLGMVAGRSATMLLLGGLLLRSRDA